MEDLGKLFHRTRRSPRPGTYSLTPVLGNLHVSRLPKGEASLVLSLEAHPGQRVVEFGALRLEIHPEADLRLGRKTETSAIGVLTCSDDGFFHQFLILASDMCATLAMDARALCSAGRFTSFVDDWADVFARVRPMTSEEETGLWGELEVLIRLPRSTGALEAWHGPEAAPFDFAGDRVYLEVKTSLVGHKHHFGLEQVSPPSDASRVFLASLRVADDPAAGLSLDEQVERVRARHGFDVALDRKLAKLRYRPGASNMRLSLGECRFIDGALIPRPRQIDKGVSGVHFVADVDRLAVLGTAQVKSLLGMVSTNGRGPKAPPGR